MLPLRRLASALCASTWVALLSTSAPGAQPPEPDLTVARAVLLSMDYTGGDEIGVSVYPRESCMGSYRDVVQTTREGGGGPTPIQWPDAQFPMTLSAPVDYDDLPDRILLTLVYKKPIDPEADEFPPYYAATVEVAFYLTTARRQEPNVTILLSRATFDHPELETRHTPHGMEVLLCEATPIYWARKRRT